ncbi:xanthine dehydrogenase/oxidase-like isoform X2 [Apostichopus japonicus]|uniref:xanthine dehydrogenase/oxidase-like isoform X2 n=1 Tax=Stichopus japonicus TaxID=307972 RepID=UPI003AB8AC3C
MLSRVTSVDVLAIDLSLKDTDHLQRCPQGENCCQLQNDKLKSRNSETCNTGENSGEKLPLDDDYVGVVSSSEDLISHSVKITDQLAQTSLKDKHDVNANTIPVDIYSKQTKMATDLFRSEKFVPYNQTQEPIFPPELLLHGGRKLQKSVRFISERVRWFRPGTLDELLELKSRHPEGKIVVGNTEVGVEVKLKDRFYPILIAATHVKELIEIKLQDDGVLIGASVNLTTLEKFLRQCITDLPEWKTRFFKGIVEMLGWFSGTQIRNVACVGGNIMTASPISDLNPLLMAGECILHIASKSGCRIVTMDDNFFTGYRKTKLNADEILTSIFLPFTTQREFFFCIKQSTREEDDIAIVNAGMKVSFHDGSDEVESLKLCYGGMASTTVMAITTMKQLKGRTWDNSLLEDACHTLAEDLLVLPGAPGGREAYRQSLSLSFFFKFYLFVLKALKETQLCVSVPPIPEKFQSALPSSDKREFQSTQLFEEVPSSQPEIDSVGRPVMHVSSFQQSTGEAIFLDDIPKYQNELFMAFVFSEKAHARIMSVEFSEALALTGVQDVITHKDVPGTNKVNFIPEDLFAVHEVTCVGQIIAAVVADSKAIARRAAKLVKVSYEELDAIITLEDAFEKKSFMGSPKSIVVGDVDAAFTQADHVIQGEVRVGAQEHFYMETQGAIAVPKNEGGEMEIISSDQNLSGTQINIAGVLGVKRHKIICRCKRLGGGFGGKETKAGMFASAVAVAAKKVKRPVRYTLDRDEDMRSSGTRSAFIGKYKVGCTKEGRILGLDLTLAVNSGNTIDLSAAVCDYAMMALDNAYKIPNVRALGYVCKTNIPSCTAMRGFGVPQGLFITETWLSDIATTCNITQRKVREINFLQPPRDKSLMNQCLKDWNIPRCWDLCLQKSCFNTRRHQVDKFNKENRWKKRGLAITPSKHGVGMHPKYQNQAGALVHIYSDGSILISHGGVEMGQGLHTKMIQVASQTLNVSKDNIYISETSTDKVPNTTQTAGSISSDINGVAVQRACESLIGRLEKYKMTDPEGTWEDWVVAAYHDAVCLSAVGFYKATGELDLDFDFDSRTGKQYFYFCYGAAVSEVEIDCLTGSHQLLRTDIVMDVGRSLNPAVDIGQIEGAFVQGYGLFVLEDYFYSPEGHLLTSGPGTYKIPGFRDIPKEFNVYLLDRAPNPNAICSSKAVGEPPLFLSASIFLAIKDAISSARTDAGLSGTFRLDSPASSERIRMACQDQFTMKFPEPQKGSYNPFLVRP